MSVPWICLKCGYSWGPAALGCQNCNGPETRNLSINVNPTYCSCNYPQRGTSNLCYGCGKLLAHGAHGGGGGGCSTVNNE